MSSCLENYSHGLLVSTPLNILSIDLQKINFFLNQEIIDLEFLTCKNLAIRTGA
jgi:hypothetical protein